MRADTDAVDRTPGLGEFTHRFSPCWWRLYGRLVGLRFVDAGQWEPAGRDGDHGTRRDDRDRGAPRQGEQHKT